MLPAQFADAVSISRQTVSRILNQDTAPEPFVLLWMARLMGVSSQQLFLAAGYTTADEPIYTYDEAWDGVMTAIQTEVALAEDMREMLVTLLQHAREHHRSASLTPSLNAQTKLAVEGDEAARLANVLLLRVQAQCDQGHYAHVENFGASRQGQPETTRHWHRTFQLPASGDGVCVIKRTTTSRILTLHGNPVQR